MAQVNKICILAVGLISGSLATALKKTINRECFAKEIIAWGRKEVNLKKAVELGIVDGYELDLAAAVQDADIVVIATPTLIAEKMIEQLKPLVTEKTIVTDVASVKGNLARKAVEVYGAMPANLVLAHPIAGSEKSGVTAFNPDLYINHKVILTPDENTDPQALAVVQNMWEYTGATVVQMPVQEHDEVLAATSHLPHVLAYALVDALAGSPDQQAIFEYAAGGFRDFTRIAASDPTMWHDISLANDRAIIKMLDQFSEQLSVLRQAIVEHDSEALMTSFTRAKAAREKFSELLKEQGR